MPAGKPWITLANMSDLTPEEQAEQNNRLETAKQSAHEPIFAPIEWFDAAGIESVYGELQPFSAGRKFAAPVS